MVATLYAGTIRRNVLELIVANECELFGTIRQYVEREDRNEAICLLSDHLYKYAIRGTLGWGWRVLKIIELTSTQLDDVERAVLRENTYQIDQ